MYLLDTNTLSELRKRKPNQGLLDFFNYVIMQKIECYISIISFGEIYAGIINLRLRNDPIQAEFLQQWYERLRQQYHAHTLAFDEKCVMNWSGLMGKNPQNAVDKQIGATALVYDLTLVTRNTKHFADTPVKLLNPFS